MKYAKIYYQKVNSNTKRKFFTMDLEKETKRIDLNAKFFGIDTLLLMENAGRCVAEECKNFSKILIFSHPKNQR